MKGEWFTKIFRLWLQSKLLADGIIYSVKNRWMSSVLKSQFSNTRFFIYNSIRKKISDVNNIWLLLFLFFDFLANNWVASEFERIFIPLCDSLFKLFLLFLILNDMSRLKSNRKFQTFQNWRKSKHDATIDIEKNHVNSVIISSSESYDRLYRNR